MYELSWEGDGVVQRYSGFVSANEYIESSQRVLADPRFDDLRFIVSDWRDANGHDIDSDTLAYVAATHIGARRTNPNIRVLVVAREAGADSIAEAMKKRSFDLAYETNTFPSVALARGWLESQPRLRRMPMPGRFSMSDEALGPVQTVARQPPAVGT